MPNKFKKFLCTLLIRALSLITPTSATEEAAEPLHTASPHVALHPSPTPPTCWERGLATLPDWYNPCLGPIVTNIKHFDLDPYWVNNRSASFQEIYNEIEPCCAVGLSIGNICHPGKFVREARKLCIITRTQGEVEHRYDPFSNWCNNLCLLGGVATAVAGGSIIDTNLLLGCQLLSSGMGCCVISSGCLAFWCCLAKIHYGPASGGCLDYLRSTPE
jgi:hypothetical protein